MRASEKWASTLVAVLVLLAGLAACGGAKLDAPTIDVVTTIWPLDQVVSAIGGNTVRVTDVASPGTDPRTIRPSPAQTAALRRAALVVEPGGGFQPAVESAASGARRVFTLAPRFGPAASGVWLDPTRMETQVLPAVAAALTAANPRAKGRYQDGERDLYEKLLTTSGDYQDALSACPQSQMAGPDGMLEAVADQYRLHLHVLGASDHPSPLQVATAAGTLQTNRIRTAFTEPGVPTATVIQAAARAGVRTRSYNTLLAPPTGQDASLSYAELLEADLATLAGGFGCPSNTDSQS